MSDIHKSRRQFLRQSLRAGSSLGVLSLAGCGTFDRLFGMDPGLYEGEVLIVGAGLAGLAAAYELKKRGVPFRLIEASTRPGGKVQSLQYFHGDLWAELGGEYIDPSQVEIISLCRELGVTLSEVPSNPGGRGTLYWSGENLLSGPAIEAPVRSVMNRLIERRRAALAGADPLQAFGVGAPEGVRALDQMSAKELLESLRTPSSARGVDYLLAASRVQHGVEPEELSAAAFLGPLDPQGRTGALRRVEGGSEVLVRTLYDRIRGVLPEFLVKFRTSLESLRERGDRFECRLRTPSGTQTIWTRSLILAVPPQALRKIGGLQELQLSEARRDALKGMKQAAHTKLLLGTESRFWREASQGPILSANLLGLSGAQSVTDASRGRPGPLGVLSFTLGGAGARAANAGLREVAEKDLQKVWRRSLPQLSAKQAFRNWSLPASGGGSFLAYRPGELTKWNGVFGEGDYEGRLFFAGEHTSERFYGSMQGAVESGQRAARQVAAALEEALRGMSFEG